MELLTLAPKKGENRDGKFERITIFRPSLLVVLGKRRSSRWRSVTLQALNWYQFANYLTQKFVTFMRILETVRPGA